MMVMMMMMVMHKKLPHDDDDDNCTMLMIVMVLNLNSEPACGISTIHIALKDHRRKIRILGEAFRFLYFFQHLIYESSHSGRKYTV